MPTTLVFVSFFTTEEIKSLSLLQKRLRLVSDSVSCRSAISFGFVLFFCFCLFFVGRGGVALCLGFFNFFLEFFLPTVHIYVFILYL